MSMRNLFDEFEQFFNEFDHYFKFKPTKIIGDSKTERGSDEYGNWVKQTFSSKDGSYQVSTFYRTSKKTSEIDELQNELESCIQKQEYEKAAELRDKIKSLKQNQDQIKELQRKLDEAIKNQEYEVAAQIRDQIKGM